MYKSMYVHNILPAEIVYVIQTMWWEMGLIIVQDFSVL